MYFKRLELVGFKSFMDKTVLNFEPGVTAVVGPNGCGKSNIFDSIRWVLGEQSVKSLRGSSMEDVIFNGTDAKPALGMAEVSLTFDNANHHFPVDHDEVIITRRLFRSGESEYLLNRAQCRLKDITDLLLGTGIGAESYSIVAQGKIDMILSSRPEDRRAVFDEASGITKYKSHKREALRRLEETDQNLLRVNDIITEVKRSIGYLERQANKARRYQVAFDELKKKETCLARIEGKKISLERAAIEAELAALTGQESGLQAKIIEQEQLIDSRSRDLETLEERLNLFKDQIVEAQNQLQRNVQHVDFNDQHIRELEGTRQYLEEQIAQDRERLTLEEGKLSRLAQEQAGLKLSLQEKTEALKVSEEKLNSVVSAMKASQETISSSKNRIMELASKSSGVKNEITDVNSKQHVHDSRKNRLVLEKGKINEERSQVENSLSSLSGELLEMERQFAGLLSEITGRRQELETETKTLESVTAELDGLERQKLSLISQKEFLERLKSQYEDITESMNAEIYIDKLPLEKIAGLVIKVRDNPVEVSQAGAKTGFRMSGEAKPIDLNAENVNEKLRLIEDSITGLSARREQLSKSIAILTEAVRVLGQNEQEQQLLLGNKRTVHHSIVEQYTKIKEEEEIIVLELSDVEIEMAGLIEKMAGLQQSLAALELESQTLESSIHAEQENISNSLRSKEEVLVGIAKLKTEIENLVKRVSSEEGAVKAMEETCAVARENIESQKKKIQETVERSAALQDEIGCLKQKNMELESDLKEKQAQLASEENRRLEMSGAVEEARKGIDERRKGLEILKEQSYEKQMKQKDLEYNYQTIKERLSSAYKMDLDAVLVERVVPFSLPDPVIMLIEYSGPALPVDESLVPLDQVDQQLLAEEIQKLKDKIDGYGTVNLVAIEEYEELKKRYDFLTQQHSDLCTAKQSLQDAIQKINRTTRKMFLETFTKVAEEFRNYFKMLFNGGDAQVYLIDENDPLESGIEIICRPPGKKLQNVLLLSGGEKSMSAIALIFAIFKVKPAPFCILDEIDAALDESNVERFSRLFQEFTGTSQFICITHNKRTIANADVMYGITMQESGVSKIVSVKFSDTKKVEKQDKEPEPVAA